MNKKCIKCNKEKNTAEFPKYGGNTCKECRAEYNKKLKESKKIEHLLLDKDTIKICGKCGKEKKIVEFYCGQSQCIECIKEYQVINADKISKRRKKHYNDNREIILKEKVKYYHKHKDKLNAKHKEDRLNNHDYYLKYDKEYRDLHKEEVKLRKENWRNKNKEYIKNYNRKYRQLKKKEINEQVKHKKRTNTNYRLAAILRARLRKKLKGKRKSDHIMILVGCDTKYLKQHLQQTAIQNGYSDFDINNFSGVEYHVDHIIPCDAFNLTCSYHQKLCFNWSNMQILKAEENIKKFNTIQKEVI